MIEGERLWRAISAMQGRFEHLQVLSFTKKALGFLGVFVETKDCLNPESHFVQAIPLSEGLALNFEKCF